MKVGFIAGSFDLIHPGYIKMFEDAKTVCSHLIIGLQTDPSLDRSEKNKPVHSLEERKLILSSIKQVDEILVYDTEESLYNLLKNTHIDVRVLGTDYTDRENYTGKDLDIPIHFHLRDHDWSASSLREKIWKNFGGTK